MTDDRLQKLQEKFIAGVQDFGTPEYNHAERRKLWHELKKMQEELDNRYMGGDTDGE